MVAVRCACAGTARGRVVSAPAWAAGPGIGKMPAFNRKTDMSRLSLQQARTLIDAALACAREHGFKPMGIVVVDAAAQVVASAREDGASALRLEIALGKTGAAIGMGVNSRALVARTKDLPAFFGAVASTASQPFIPQTGAVLITDAAGAVIGAAGASGGTGDEDEQIVIAGILAAGLGHG
jgi:uncharacterized protein GlcG (DUF336 family)